MDASTKAELESIKRELRSIINELDEISRGVKKDFVGIGNERCAACISQVAEKYREASRKINNINTSRVTTGR